jgi:dTDP-4-amino-4,6-dideoxygalactose transaminase
MRGLKSFSTSAERSSTLSEWRIPLTEPDLGREEEAAVTRVLRGGWLSMGPEVQAFEQEFADFIGARHGVAVSSGTAALHLSYLVLGIEPQCEVIQPAINFVAAANMSVAVGATPVFADILGLHEPTIDPAEIERGITSRTRAVVVMHYGGYLCRMAEISDICRRHGVALIEDACHAVGASYIDSDQRPPHGKRAGNLSDISCFSFFSNKNLAVGEGGMVLTNRDDLAEKLRLFRSHGMTTLTWDRHRGHASSYDVLLCGFNYRLDEIRAALGRVQLKKLEQNNQIRKHLVSLYRQNLAALSDWIVPFKDHPDCSSYHLMVIVAPDGKSRDKAVQKLKDAGIQTSMHYPCLPRFKALQRPVAAELIHSNAFSERAITLPLSTKMTASQVTEVCSIIYDAVKQD